MPRIWYWNQGVTKPESQPLKNVGRIQTCSVREELAGVWTWGVQLDHENGAELFPQREAMIRANQYKCLVHLDYIVLGIHTLSSQLGWLYLCSYSYNKTWLYVSASQWLCFRPPLKHWAASVYTEGILTGAFSIMPEIPLQTKSCC